MTHRESDRRIGFQEEDVEVLRETDSQGKLFRGNRKDLKISVRRKDTWRVTEVERHEYRKWCQGMSQGSRGICQEKGRWRRRRGLCKNSLHGQRTEASWVKVTQREKHESLDSQDHFSLEISLSLWLSFLWLCVLPPLFLSSIIILSRCSLSFDGRQGRLLLSWVSKRFSGAAHSVYFGSPSQRRRQHQKERHRHHDKQIHSVLKDDDVRDKHLRLDLIPFSSLSLSHLSHHTFFASHLQVFKGETKRKMPLTFNSIDNKKIPKWNEGCVTPKFFLPTHFCPLLDEPDDI